MNLIKRNIRKIFYYGRFIIFTTKLLRSLSIYIYIIKINFYNILQYMYVNKLKLLLNLISSINIILIINQLNINYLYFILNFSVTRLKPSILYYT